MAKDIFKTIKKALPEIQRNVLLKRYTTFKIGGPAEYFFIAKNKNDLIKAIKLAKELKLPIFIFGGGSNILVSDKGLKGIVIKMQNAKIKIQNENLKFKMIRVEGGMKLVNLVNFCINHNLTGMEWAAGIPSAAVGGSIYGNAQAFGQKISEAVESVESLDLKTLKFKKFNNKQCQFSLKNSLFKKNKNLVIVSAVLKFKKGDKKQIRQKIAEYLKYRKKNHPMHFPSAGSVFVNPESKGKIVPAGFLIEKCGLGGKKIGKAQISPIHANFIVNLGGAKAKDVLALIKLAKKRVKQNFNIDLKIELQVL